MSFYHRLKQKGRNKLCELSEGAATHFDCKGTWRAGPLPSLHHAGFEPNIVFESDDYNVAQGLVAAGMGVTLLPEMSLANARDDLIIKAVGNQAPCRRVM